MKTNITQTPSAAADKIAHTPGPWNAEIKTVHVISRYGLCECDVDSKDLLICCARGTNKAEAVDNALLIAAAPELLEALRKIKNATHPTSDYHEIAERAINKAEGK